jgi:hypothetical protein
MASASAPFFIALLSLVLIIGYIAWNERRMRIFLRDTGAKNVSDTLRDLNRDVTWARTEHEKKSSHLAHIESRLARSIQKVETVRFNAFRDSGGGQSFATALLDESGNGIILSTLAHRDHVSIFSKPVENYVSPVALSPEETEALNRTRE